MAVDFRCPECGKGVFNTRLDECEFCGAALPEELRMTDAQKEKIALELARKEKERREERRRRARQGPQGGSHGCAGGAACGGCGGI